MIADARAGFGSCEQPACPLPLLVLITCRCALLSFHEAIYGFATTGALQLFDSLHTHRIFYSADMALLRPMKKPTLGPPPAERAPRWRVVPRHRHAVSPMGEYGRRRAAAAGFATYEARHRRGDERARHVDDMPREPRKMMHGFRELCHRDAAGAADAGHADRRTLPPPDASSYPALAQLYRRKLARVRPAK